MVSGWEVERMYDDREVRRGMVRSVLDAARAHLEKRLFPMNMVAPGTTVLNPIELAELGSVLSAVVSYVIAEETYARMVGDEQEQAARSFIPVNTSAAGTTV